MRAQLFAAEKFLIKSPSPVLSPVRIGAGHYVRARRRRGVRQLAELVGGDVYEGGEVAVVGVLQGEHLGGAAGVDPGHAECQVVGLGARVDEVDHAQRVGEGGHQATSVQHQVVVQESAAIKEKG